MHQSIHQTQHLDAVAGTVVGAFWLIIFISYALLSWGLRKLLMRKRGLIIPLFEPPSGISPAGAGYILNGIIDEKVCLAAIMDMERKGYLSIKKTGNDFTLEKIKSEGVDLFEEEKILAKHLFSMGNTFVLKNIVSRFVTVADNRLLPMLQIFKAKLKELYKSYVSSIRFGFHFAMVMSFFAIASTAGVMGVDLFIYLITMLAVLTFILSFYGIWAYVNTREKGNLSVVIIFFILSVASYFLYFNEHWAQASAAFPEIIIPFVFSSGIIVIDAFLYRLPMVYMGNKSKVRNDLEGFKLFLSTAFEGTYKAMDQTLYLQAKDRFLPFAIAFGIEKAWLENIAGEFSLVRLDDQGEAVKMAAQSEAYFSEQAKKERFIPPDLPEEENGNGEMKKDDNNRNE